MKKVEEPALEKEKPDRYWAGVGRRKTSVARARIFAKGEKDFLVNYKPYQNYFPTLDCWQIASASLNKMKALDKLRVLVKVKGGGYHSQAEAVRHAIARALVKFNPNFRKRLRKAGFLTRDPRMRERKKFGLKRARRAPQWAKR
ncbi:MAG: 30S ribosomal protein S9 [Candidatus Nealsonbacteria bacterium RBG_13_36_15]|uniref:Small ribosomal subunit protein uS9 n=1 Tax=Candidatus Nealsonbacteria bacterium RBG_13_36_15 TaxID=1801660 RepID=A0A1G2DVH6_9BACT|nr:MAG: 30S ribosomal protein S9 [Candidatus Nealsonbacteria bacterium RBG_13_36_15]